VKRFPFSPQLGRKKCNTVGFANRCNSNNLTRFLLVLVSAVLSVLTKVRKIRVQYCNLFF